MSTPNPLIPQGTFQSQAAKGASNVRIAVATIVAIHLVFFGGLLLQGCKRDTRTAGAADTNAAAAAPTNLTLPPIDSNQLYYSSASNLPGEASNTLAGASRFATNPALNNFASTPAASQAATQDVWQSTNPGASAKPAAGEAEHAPGATREYTVARADTYAKIAKANGTTVNALKAANPGIDPAKIRPGMKLNVPVSGNAAAFSAAPSAGAGQETSATAAGSAPSGNVYTVRSGDTLTKIARAHGVSVSQLRAANNLRTSRVNVGQKLKIPAAGENAGAATNLSKRTHAKTNHKSSSTSSNAPSATGI